jgi:hypothetical protein
MKLKNDNPLELLCQEGEVITVTVQASGTRHLVSYSLLEYLESRSKDQFMFTVDSARSNPTILAMLFRFSSRRGGMYKVQVSGSNEGSSEYFVRQFAGQQSRTLIYIFEIPDAPRTVLDEEDSILLAGGLITTRGQKRKKFDEPRFVNINFVDSREKRLIPRTAALDLNQTYYLRINIGPLSQDTAVLKPRPFPVKYLPPAENGYWLEAVVVSDDFELERHRYSVFLPVKGASWVCGCSKETSHTCDAKTRDEYVYIWAKPKKARSEAQMRIGIYYQNNLIQSQLLTAVVGQVEQERKGYSSTIDYTLTASLNNLASFAPRALNILTNENDDGTHRIVINGALDDAVTFNLSEGKVSNAIGAVRQKLLDLHVRVFGGHLGSELQYENLYDNNNAKSRDDFVADLRALAPCGKLLWDTLLTEHQPEQRRKVRTELLRDPATIQVSRIRWSSFVFPWGAVYDIPLESDPTLHRTCRLLDEWNQASTLINAVQPDCPYRESHQKNTICPFGFWGFRHIIEQPPSMPSGLNLQKTINVANRPMEFLAALSLDLDQSLTDSHLKALGTKLAKIMNVLPYRSRKEIETALSKPKLEIVYFYCHGERQPVAGSNAPVPFLEIGDREQLTTGDLITWSDSDWDTEHWRHTSPLVFINGCHTAELTPQVLVNFVDTFVGVKAAGVIGTEIMLHQRVANEAAQIFFDHFKNPKCSVGRALQQMRRSLLLKGNLLGLAYTPYCSTDLKLSELSTQ